MNLLRKITQDEFDILYSQHREWLIDNKNSKPNFSNIDFRNIRFSEFTNLSGADLPGADLSGANLPGANLSWADLSRANFTGVNLTGADLTGADLSWANLSKADLTKADLPNADLPDADLTDADLTRADLTRADLTRADLARANFTRANLTRANLTRANLSDADLSDADLTGTLSQKMDNNETSTLNQLTQELQRLKSKTATDSDAIKKKEEEIEQLKTQLERIGEEIKSGLESSFDTLNEANKDIENEIKRLDHIFWGCILFIVIMFIPLICIWCTAFCDLRNVFELSKILLYTSPSLIILSFIFGSVVLMNRSQRQIVSLCKFMRKYSVIKIALKGYYSVQEKHLRTPNKAQEVFDAIIYENIRENIDTDKEEEKIQQMDSKDRFLQKAAVDECLNVLSKLKDIIK